MRRIVLGVGLLLVLAGMAWPWLGKIPLGRLPGDIVVERPGFRLYVPLTTMTVVSVLVSFLAWLFRK